MSKNNIINLYLVFSVCMFCVAFTITVLAQTKPNDEPDIETASKFNKALQQQYKEDLKGVVSQITTSLETKENPMVKRAENAYEGYENSSVASAFFDSIKEITEENEPSSSRVLLLFISSSMPERVIKQYLAQAESINKHIMVVMRGTIDNSLRLLPTIEYLKKIKMFDGCGEALCQRQVNTVIDPRLFEQYDITQVPALAYSGEFSNFGYFENQVLPKRTNHTVVIGEATLPFLIKTLSQEINDESLTALAQTYVF